jgi:hypothetical protein
MSHFSSLPAEDENDRGREAKGSGLMPEIDDSAESSRSKEEAAAGILCGGEETAEGMDLSKYDLCTFTDLARSQI